ncbi:MAG: STAS domain-containing protein [Variovorax sp.]|nr:MAG: STAS domain-containing protein [Variovorax sp.]
MAKEESGRLFSKVAKFVRNPLKDWSELDAEDSASPENGYSREMLKEMIERRQRNDFVRRREFDMLRKLRQREAAGVQDGSATPSSFNVNSTSGKSEGRALTLKKIDEIEEQMSQQWWKGRGPGGSAPGHSPESGADMAEQHARAYADTAPFSPQEAAALAVPLDSGAGALHPSRLVYSSALEEAAIRFAEGKDAEAESILLQALAPEGAQADHDDTWRALLDLYRATGDAEKFVAASTRYAQRMKRTGPEWVSLRALARTVQAASAAQRGQKAAASGADWLSPARLSRDALGGLTAALAQAGAVWTLDWRGLKRIDAEAAGPLRALFTHWAESAVQLRFAGGKQLQAVLAEATPMSERGTDDLWWQLRLAALRVMHLADDFELAALNYCITYEVSPPGWQDPRGGYEAIDAARESSPAFASAFSLEGTGEVASAIAGGADALQVALAGDLAGESLSTWQRLDAELLEAPAPVVSCAALVRIDFAAAGTLLNWVMERDAHGQRVEFVDAHRLVAAFFGVIGIGDHAMVSARFD